MGFDLLRNSDSVYLNAFDWPALLKIAFPFDHRSAAKAKISKQDEKMAERTVIAAPLIWGLSTRD